MIYVAIFAALIGLHVLSSNSTQLRRFFYAAFLIALFVFSAFRFEVGCDWTGYFNQFEVARWGGGRQFDFAGREPVWWGLIRLTHWLELPYPWLNVFSSAIFFIGAHVLARRQPDPLGFLILLFPILILNMPMSAIRQGAAIGIICIALTRFVDKKLIRFVAWTILASLLHSSAIIFLFLIPFVRGGLSAGNVLAAGVLAIPGAFMLATSEDAEVLATRYLLTDVDAGGAIFRLGLLLVAGIAYMWFLRRPWHLRFPDAKIATIGSALMAAAFPLLLVSTVVADRFGYYLIPILAMIYSRLPYLPGRESKLIAILPYLILLITLAGWTMMSRHFQLCYVPYNNWLFG